MPLPNKERTKEMKKPFVTKEQIEEITKLDPHVRGIPREVHERMIPDKLKYTRGEKAAEITGGAALAAFAAVMITLMALNVTGGGNIILLVVMLMIYGIFSVCSVYPQWTNVLKKPESASDRDFHKVRRGCIIAKLTLVSAVFLLSMPIFG